MNNVAIYIDQENLHAQLFNLVHGEGAYGNQFVSKQPYLTDVGAIIEYARADGRVVLAKAYANWTRFGSYASTLMSHNIDTIQLFPRGKSAKNGADIRMSLDCLEDVAAMPGVDRVVIVSNDSDFTPLVQKLHARGKKVLGIGTRSANRYLASSCDVFTHYEDIVTELPQPISVAVESAGMISPSAALPLAKAKSALLSVVRDLIARRGESEVKLAAVKPALMRAIPGFSETQLGFATFGDFMGASRDVVIVRKGPFDKLVSLTVRDQAPDGMIRQASEPAVVRLVV